MKLFPHPTYPPGVSFALAAALLFGISTPVAKILLGQVAPVQLAGLLYLGSGSGLTICWWLRLRFQPGYFQEASLHVPDLPWLAGATLAGGIAGPLLLLVGLSLTPASSASLLLNLEGVFTAAIAWFAFQEHFDFRIALGMAAITAGGLLLSWVGHPELASFWGPGAIIGACLAWGIDNNLTRKIAAGDPLQIAAAKGLIAGAVNLVLARVAGMDLPPLLTVATSALIGFLSYGVSLTCFVLALRYIGTARTGAYFSLAPFIGAALSIVILGEPLTRPFLVAAGFMGVGFWLHLTERHEHKHTHELLEHDHRHTHDEHHQHGHREEPHSHLHSHPAIFHSHPHYPDIHHRHGH
jgi:drug/metabolite transporter (DMT)-like permease